LESIHANPSNGVWNLAEDECEYKHSSAKFYVTGEQGEYVVSSYTELEDIDLTK
jgi:hypothetical protein